MTCLSSSFERVRLRSCNASNFFKFYSGSSDTSGYEQYDEKFYGYSNTSTQYRWVFIKFEIMQNTKGGIWEYLPLNININNVKISFFIFSPFLPKNYSLYGITSISIFSKLAFVTSTFNVFPIVYSKPLCVFIIL